MILKGLLRVKLFHVSCLLRALLLFKVIFFRGQIQGKTSQWNASRPSTAAVRQREMNMRQRQIPTHGETTQHQPPAAATGLGATYRERDEEYCQSKAWWHDTRIKHPRLKPGHR